MAHAQLPSSLRDGLPFAFETRSPSRTKRREGALWQRRFWEQQIRDEIDLLRHVEYIHYNPVKHGHVARVRDWPHSTFHKYVRSGIYPQQWGDEGYRVRGLRRMMRYGRSRASMRFAALMHPCMSQARPTLTAHLQGDLEHGARIPGRRLLPEIGPVPERLPVQADRRRRAGSAIPVDAAPARRVEHHPGHSLRDHPVFGDTLVILASVLRNPIRAIVRWGSLYSPQPTVLLRKQ